MNVKYKLLLICAIPDKLLTLSTCDNTGKNRILVHAVNINKE